MMSRRQRLAYWLLRVNPRTHVLREVLHEDVAAINAVQWSAGVERAQEKWDDRVAGVSLADWQAATRKAAARRNLAP